MSVVVHRPLLFLDVDGPLLPFGLNPQQMSEEWDASGNPLFARLDPLHGPRLLSLPCDLVWATAWMADANVEIAPRIGLPELPVVVWADPFADEDPEGLHWKTRDLVDWAGDRSFVWVDDEITDADRVWVMAHHRREALLHRVDPRRGLTDADFAAIIRWLGRLGRHDADTSA